jgi:hypothetical protein
LLHFFGGFFVGLLAAAVADSVIKTLLAKVLVAVGTAA